MVKASESSIALGQRLKQVRQLKGLSQRELGRRAGVTNSNISMIEQGLISPSVTSLQRLLAVIPMSLEQFFTWNPGAAEGEVFRSGSLPAVLGSGSGLRIETLAPDRFPLADNTGLCLERFLLDPGSDTGDHFIKAPDSILGWLVRGKIELSLGAREFFLSESDGFYVPAQQVYRLRNTTDAEAVLVLTRSPAKGAA